MNLVRAAYPRDEGGLAAECPQGPDRPFFSSGSLRDAPKAQRFIPIRWNPRITLGDAIVLRGVVICARVMSEGPNASKYDCEDTEHHG